MNQLAGRHAGEDNPLCDVTSQRAYGLRLFLDRGETDGELTSLPPWSVGCDAGPAVVTAAGPA
jgi:hypothetical protein